MIDELIIVVYLLILLIIGVYLSKRQKTEEDFFLAHRKLGSFHAAASVFSTLAGAGTIFASIALGYTYGISIMWFFVAGFIGLFIFSFAAPKIKKISDENGCITLPELLKTKLDRKTSILASIITIIIFGGFVAVNFLVAGNILKIVFDIPIIPVIILFALIVLLYSLLGGFKAVIWTDIFQMFLILIGMLMMIFISLDVSGGFSSIGKLPENLLDPFGMGLTLIIGLFVSTILAYFASQDLFQRIFATKDQKTAKKSTYFMGILFVLGGILFMLVGLFGRALFPDIMADQVIPIMTTNLIPVGLVGFILVSYLAMANSTADSEMLTVTSNIMRDFICSKDSSKKLTSQSCVTVSRLILIIIAIVSLTVAILVPNIVNIILSLYTWLGILGLNVIATLFWKRTTSNAVFTSLVLGFGSAVVYSFLTKDFETAMIVGLIPAALSLFIISIFSSKQKMKSNR